MESNNRTVSMVNADLEASLIEDVMRSNPEFDSLHLDSVMVARAPGKVIAEEDLKEGEWADDKSFVDQAHKNIQELRISKLAMGPLLETD